MTTLAGRDLRGMVFWLMGDLSTPVSPGMQWIFTVGLLAGIGAIYTTSADLNLLLTGEREATHLGVDVTRVKLVVYVSRVAADGAGRFRQRRDRLRWVARAARGAIDFRVGLPAADSRFGVVRRDRHRSGGYAGAHHRRAHGIAGRRDDGDGRRAGIHLFASARIAMSALSPFRAYGRRRARSSRIANARCGSMSSRRATLTQPPRNPRRRSRWARPAFKRTSANSSPFLAPTPAANPRCCG